MSKIFNIGSKNSGSGGTVNINVEGILKGDGKGNVTPAVPGVDYTVPNPFNENGYMNASVYDSQNRATDVFDYVENRIETIKASNPSIAISFTVSLLANSWDENYEISQIVYDTRLLAEGYEYFISSVGDESYCSLCGIVPGTVDTDGQIKFTCINLPEKDITIKILRIKLADSIVTENAGLLPIIDVTVASGSRIQCTDGVTTLSGTSNSNNYCRFTIPNFGRWTISAYLDGIITTEEVVVDAVKLYSVSMYVKKIYGVIWDGTSTTAWARTDAAEGFRDPMPYVNNGKGSSPFDNIYPWAGMKRVSDPEAGELVSIPKFWFKWTDNGASGLQLQIADYPAEGFYVSPAHGDYGDGQGERDIVYVGRYYCSKGVYASITNAEVLTSMTMPLMRGNVEALGSDIHLMDAKMYWTICMLYLVEYADWDSQRSIGYGIGPAATVSGMSDSAEYHSGCSQSSRITDSNNWIQYRHIENLWNGAYKLRLDGAYFVGAKLYIINNLNQYPDSDSYSGGTLVGEATTSRVYPTQMAVCTIEGFEWYIYPNAWNGGSNSTYISDYFSGGSSSYHFGTGYSDFGGGLFSHYGRASTDTSSDTVCRLMKLPNNIITDAEDEEVTTDE